MREYSSPEAVDVGSAGEKINGLKISDPPDCEIGSTLRLPESVLDCDE